MKKVVFLPEDKRLLNQKKMDKLMESKDGVLVRTIWFQDKHGADQVTRFENEENEYNAILETYNKECIAVNEGFDNLPAVTIDFGEVAWFISLAYGCPLVKMEGRINAEPIYFTVEEAAKMKKRERIYEHGLYPHIDRRILEFQRRYPQIPIHIPDNQSSIDVATCIMHSEEAMFAMFDEPDMMHYILNILTESIIEINRHYKSLINNFAGFQCHRGMHVSDDNAAFLSPSIYSEFAVPYAEKLSDEFGGIDFHCCMGYEQNIKNMVNTRGFLGFDPQVDFNDSGKIIAAITGTKGVWHLNNYPWQKRQDRESSDEEMFKSIIDMTEGICPLEISVCTESMEEALELGTRVKDYAINKGRAIEI